MKKMISTRQLILLSLLIAMDVLFSRVLALNTSLVKIGLGFAATGVAALLYGPWWAAAESALADTLGALLFPTGAYNPCFSVTALCTGLIFGLCLRGERPSALRCLMAAGLNCLLVELTANTLLIHWFFGAPLAWPFLALRLLKFAVMLPVEFLVLWLLARNGALRGALEHMGR